MAITAPRFMCSTLALAHSLHPLSGLEYNDSFIYFESISFHFLLLALKINNSDDDDDCNIS
jgi:hypothetical protein